MDASVAAVGRPRSWAALLDLRLVRHPLVGAMGLLGAWAWGRRTGWRNRDEIVRGFGTIFLSVGMLLLLHGIALRVGAGLVGLATATFVVAFLQGSKLKRPSLRLVRGEGVARPRFS